MDKRGRITAGASDNKDTSNKRGNRLTVLCADEVMDRLFELAHSATDRGFSVRVTDLAFLCVYVCATCKPQAVLLDEDLFQVDSWSVPEVLHLISPETAIVLTVEKPESWQPPPPFVNAVATRSNVEEVMSVLQRVLDTALPNEGKISLHCA